jgi:arginase
VIELIGAPFDLCGFRAGSRLGPAALRFAGLLEALQEMGLPVADGGDIQPDLTPSFAEGLRNFAPMLACVRTLRQRVAESLHEGNLPIMLGGEHTLAVASVSAALQHHGDSLAVLWIDAHADVNTPGGSVTGNLHGMPLAALWGLPSEAVGVQHQQWESLVSALGAAVLRPERTAWYGLRDVDAAERPRLRGLPLTMHDIDRFGVAATVQRLQLWLEKEGIRKLWVSFDVDVLDPILAPGTGTAVRGGLSYREAHLLAELLHESLRAAGTELIGLDLVEVNPLVDRYNETAQVAVEWVASLFGKTILGVTA